MSVRIVNEGIQSDVGTGEKITERFSGPPERDEARRLE